MLKPTSNSVQVKQKEKQKTNSLYEVKNKPTASKGKVYDISVWWILLLKILKSARIPFIAGKHQFLKKYEELFGTPTFPWFKLSLLALILYMVFQKDMHFQVNMKSPNHLFSDDRSHNEEPTALSMSLTHPDGPSQSMTSKKANSPLSLADDKVQAYINRFSRIAIMEMQKFQIPASIKMGQGLLASQAGNNLLATKFNNHFGTLCADVETACGQFTSGNTNVQVKKYESAWEGWRDHSTMISAGPYTELKKHGKDYKKWAVGIAKIGYGNNQSYSQQLISVIEQYQLYKLDK